MQRELGPRQAAHQSDNEPNHDWTDQNRRARVRHQPMVVDVSLGVNETRAERHESKHRQDRNPARCAPHGRRPRPYHVPETQQ
jgi:hypothetical protein